MSCLEHQSTSHVSSAFRHMSRAWKVSFEALHLQCILASQSIFYRSLELRGSTPRVYPRLVGCSFCYFSLDVMSFEALQHCIVPASSPQTSMQHVICAEPRGSAQPEHPRLGITHMYGSHESLSLVQHVSAGSRLRCCTPNSGGHGRPVRPPSHSECARQGFRAYPHCRPDRSYT